MTIKALSPPYYKDVVCVEKIHKTPTLFILLDVGKIHLSVRARECICVKTACAHVLEDIQGLFSPKVVSAYSQPTNTAGNIVQITYLVFHVALVVPILPHNKLTSINWYRMNKQILRSDVNLS